MSHDTIIAVNADTRLRVAIDTAELAWVPLANGLHEKVLEDDGASRRTSIVHVPTGARLPSGSFEMFVLSGSVDGFKPGSYLRGVVPTQFDDAMVLLKQRTNASRLAIRFGDIAFDDLNAPVSRARLSEEPDGKVVAMLRFAPNSMIGDHGHHKGEEFFVLDGEVRDEYGTYSRNWWVRQPPDSRHSITSYTGCLFLTFAHHL